MRKNSRLENFLLYCHRCKREFIIDVEDFKVTAGNGQYDFTAMVSHNYLKDPVEISGSARTDKNGKITSLAIRGCEDVKYPMGLSSQLRLD